MQDPRAPVVTSSAERSPRLLVEHAEAILRCLLAGSGTVGAHLDAMRDREHVVLEGVLHRLPPALRVLGLVDRGLGELQRIGIALGDPLGQRHRLLFESIPRHHTIDQARLLGVGGADEIAGEQVFLGLARAEVPRHREILHVAAAPLHGAVSELGVLARDDDVAGRGDHHPAHDAVALDLGDGRLGQVAPAHRVLEEAFPEAAILAPEAGLERRLLLVLHLLRAAEIVPGGEMLAGAGQDDYPYVVVLHPRGEGIVELLEQDPALRVQHLRPVGRDLEDGPGAFGEKRRIGHAAACTGWRSSGARPAPIRSMKLSQ